MGGRSILELYLLNKRSQNSFCLHSSVATFSVNGVRNHPIDFYKIKIDSMNKMTCSLKCVVNFDLGLGATHPFL